MSGFSSSGRYRLCFSSLVQFARGGPVLAALRAWHPVLGMVFGAFGEADVDVERLAQELASLQADFCIGQVYYYESEPRR